jgi:hypothetical protein
MRVVPSLLCLLAGLVLAAPASAQGGLPAIGATLTSDGWPHLTASSATPSAPAPTWRVCAPDCGAVVAEGTTFAPGPTAVGTAFEATITAADGTTTTDRTPAWQGRVAVAAPPTVTGEARIGRPVATQPGTWTGGWGDEFSVAGLRACRTPEATNCREVAPGNPFGPGRQAATTAVDPAFAGWYVGAWERRYASRSVFPAVAIVPPPFGTPADERPAVVGDAVTVAFGPLIGPVPAARTGIPPRVTGSFAVGRRVTPRPGTWPDAPDGGRISTAVRACPTRRDTDACVLLNALEPGVAAPGGAAQDGRPGPGAPVTLGRKLLGWYLGAVDRHRPGGTAGAPVVVPAPSATGSDRRVPEPDLVTVHGPLAATPVVLGFTPRATIARRVRRGPRVLRLGTVRCAERCVARVTLRAGGRTVRRRLDARGGRSTAVSVPAATVGRARALRVRIAFDHHPRVVRRTVRVG